MPPFLVLVFRKDLLFDTGKLCKGANHRKNRIHIWRDANHSLREGIGERGQELCYSSLSSQLLKREYISVTLASRLLDLPVSEATQRPSQKHALAFPGKCWVQSKQSNTYCLIMANECLLKRIFKICFYFILMLRYDVLYS